MMSLAVVFWMYVILFAIIGGMRGWAKEILVSMSVILALLLASVVAQIHSDVRPFVVRTDSNLLISHTADNGFPSDHATVGFAVAGTLVWWRRWLGLVAILAACLIAFARVFVGVHWPVDVASGAAIGLFMGAVAARSVPLWVGLKARVAALLPEWAVATP